jgi:hypothetical protein
MASSRLQGVQWWLSRGTPQRATPAKRRLVVGMSASIDDERHLQIAVPRFPFNRRGNGLPTAQLGAANGEQRQLHGQTQARELGADELSKFFGLGIIVSQDAIPCRFPVACD